MKLILLAVILGETGVMLIDELPTPYFGWFFCIVAGGLAGLASLRLNNET